MFVLETSEFSSETRIFKMLRLLIKMGGVLHKYTMDSVIYRGIWMVALFWPAQKLNKLEISELSAVLSASWVTSARIFQVISTFEQVKKCCQPNTAINLTIHSINKTPPNLISNGKLWKFWTQTKVLAQMSWISGALTTAPTPSPCRSPWRGSWERPPSSCAAAGRGRRGVGPHSTWCSETTLPTIGISRTLVPFHNQ